MAKRGELTPKQKRFVEEYLVDLNATAASRRAGYSQRGNTARQQGYYNLTVPAIQEALTKAQAKRSKRTELTQDYVLNGLKTNAERAAQAEPVTDAEGNPVGEYRYEGAVANRALELLGKHLGMFADRLHVEGPMLDLSKLTDEEIGLLRSLLEKARRDPDAHDR
jgi:phage terminase small subunit